MCKQTTLHCDLVKEKSYFRQELHKLYENFIKAYFFNQTKNEAKKLFVKRASKCWKEMKESELQIREVLEKHAKAKKSPGQKVSSSE